MALFLKFNHHIESMDKKLRTVTVTQFDYILKNVDDEALDLQGHPHQYSEFNESGNPVREIRYSNSGEFEEEYLYEYDSGGGLASERYYPEQDILAEQKIYYRDDRGRIDHVEKTYQDGSVDTLRYEYDDSDHLIRVTTTTEEGEVEQVETFTWDGDRMVAQESFDSQGEPISMNDFRTEAQSESRLTRNELGQVIREEEVDETGTVYMTVDRTYDEAGRLKEVEVNFDGRGLTLSRHYFLKYEYTFFD